MNIHPALSMLGVWAFCGIAYAVLPFQLVNRSLTLQGFVILLLFIAAYIIGAMVVPTKSKVKIYSPQVHPNTITTEAWLKAASLIATVFLVLDSTSKSVFDLAASYDLRSETADALLHGQAAASSIWFKIAFMLYPAGYVYSAIHVLYAKNIKIWKVILYGFIPIALATLTMGGRLPILYALLVFWLALRERKKIGYSEKINESYEFLKKWIKPIALILATLMLFYYFALIFIVRAETAGGALEMFLFAEDVWGVGFLGSLSSVIFSILGEELTYLFFIFSWYFIQGFVMSNYLFSAYDGPTQMGAYGIDLMSAFIRRIDPSSLTDGFYALLELGSYGFFPSAWGTLYVDFGFFGVFFSFIWGLFNGLCYQRIVNQRRMGWLLFGPFVSIGILLSVINTPLGVSNAFITYGWLLFAFLSLKNNKTPTPVINTT